MNNDSLDQLSSYRILSNLLATTPDAAAILRGAEGFEEVHGETRFYQTNVGTMVVTEVAGLPCGEPICSNIIYAFHIHEFGDCTLIDGRFRNVGLHYNPLGCAHPNHAGDLAPLFCNNGYAFSAMLTARFNVDEVIGRSVIIHDNPDDFTTQPTGNAGIPIACGVIERVRVSDDDI